MLHYLIVTSLLLGFLAGPALADDQPAKQAAPEHAKYTKEATAISGLIPLYKDNDKLYAELSSTQYNSEFIVLMAISKGIGQRPLLGGFTWGFGDDWIIVFRKVGDKVHLVRRNVRFKATKGKPEAGAVAKAYSDSVLFSLPILTKGPKGGDLVDLTPIFFSDLPQISLVLRGFVFSASKSTFESVKGFKDNVVIEVQATYTSSGSLSFETVPDTRGVTLNVHYGISKLPETGYKPRLADDRVGYFTTVLKDFSLVETRDQFVRYINRWDLQKADAGSEQSPPKQPIIFWIENTVPYKYRAPIRAGILEWNRAFEKAGFINAIEVRQMPDNAEWDPEDINYNTFRWITSNAGFAMGPSRVNPYTGQILDADIIFDADFLQAWKDNFDLLYPVAPEEDGDNDEDGENGDDEASPERSQRPQQACRYNQHMSRQMALASAYLESLAAAGATGEELKATREELIMQAMKHVVMHEVGHTLGLRHNFKASALYSIEELNNKELTKDTGLAASVMDYLPVNIMPSDETQGDFFSGTIGPYDVWAIEYGYTPQANEKDALEKIASRSGEKGLAYNTDEDLGPFNPDPHVNAFDLSSDLVEQAKLRSRLVDELMPCLVDRLVDEGDDYTKARLAFNVLLSHEASGMEFAAGYVGGVFTSRSHKGDKDAPPPLEIVDAKRQRAALAMLEERTLGPKSYAFDPEIFQYLGPSTWAHWGATRTMEPAYPVHDVVLARQMRVVRQLLGPAALGRVLDNEYKTPPGEDALTLVELMDRVTAAVFAELEGMNKGEFDNRRPAISSFRRNLQREVVSLLGNLAMDRIPVPADAKTLAYGQLGELETKVEQVLKGKARLDGYSKAHLIELRDRIKKIREARLLLTSP